MNLSIYLEETMTEYGRRCPKLTLHHHVNTATRLGSKRLESVSTWTQMFFLLLVTNLSNYCSPVRYRRWSWERRILSRARSWILRASGGRKTMVSVPSSPFTGIIQGRCYMLIIDECLTIRWTDRLPINLAITDRTLRPLHGCGRNISLWCRPYNRQALSMENTTAATAAVSVDWSHRPRRMLCGLWDCSCRSAPYAPVR